MRCWAWCQERLAGSQKMHPWNSVVCHHFPNENGAMSLISADDSTGYMALGTALDPSHPPALPGWVFKKKHGLLQQLSFDGPIAMVFYLGSHVDGSGCVFFYSSTWLNHVKLIFLVLQNSCFAYFLFQEGVLPQNCASQDQLGSHHWSFCHLPSQGISHGYFQMISHQKQCQCHQTWPLRANSHVFVMWQLMTIGESHRKTRNKYRSLMIIYPLVI